MTFHPFDLAALSARDRYALLAAAVVPRPIALVTTLGESGIVNAAPFSFFNLMGSDPAIVALGIGDGKDSVRNIQSRAEFVVNLVDEALAPAMNVCAIDFPPETDELAAAKLTPLPSAVVAPPRIAESPVHLECREWTTLDIGANRLVLGEVLFLHVHDEFLENGRILTQKLGLLGRLHGSGGYARTTDAFTLPRLTLDEWRNARE